MKKRVIVIVVLLIPILAISATYIVHDIRKHEKPEKSPINAYSVIAENLDSVKSNRDDTVCIAAVGDIMLGSIVPEGWIPPNNDCTPFFKPFISILSSADITFGNFEGVFTDTKAGMKKCNDPKWCYTFGIPTKYVDCFLDAGFDVMSLANNHAYDFGEIGLKNTIKVFTENKLHFAGPLTHPHDTFSVKGIKIGFCAFAPNWGTCQITDIKGMQKTVGYLDSICDLVIVSFHGGAEGPDYEHVTRKYETYLGQNRGNVYDFAHKAIDAGGDVILGHGPHITRAIELYKDKFIVYSMGNFATFRFVRHGPYGMAPIFKIYTTKGGKFIKAEIVSVKPSNPGPQFDSTFAALKKIQALTKQDFPESMLDIRDDGMVLPK
jgi:hypothetical protein